MLLVVLTEGVKRADFLAIHSSSHEDFETYFRMVVFT
jgi:hypothetical protein